MKPVYIKTKLNEVIHVSKVVMIHYYEVAKNFAQISAVLSFENPQYFSRVFKRITGMTPTEFKRSLAL